MKSDVMDVRKNFKKFFLIKWVRANGFWTLSVNKTGYRRTLLLSAGLTALLKGVGLGFSLQDVLHYVGSLLPSVFQRN